MNISRDQIRKTKIRNGFRFQLRRNRAIWVSLAACACRWESTENCRRAQRDLQVSSCGTWPFAVSSSGSIDRSTILHAAESDVGRALFLTLKKALAQGMIGDDKDFTGKVCVKWKDTEFERQARSESLIPRRELSSSNREVDKHPRKGWFYALSCRNHGRLRF